MKVSVVIPVYKVSDYIENCLRSVMNQTYKDIECILVDDATPDDSITKCEQLIASYQGPIQFSILHHQQNRGMSAARNTGTAVATGKYIFYLDSDDKLSDDCIEKLMKPMMSDPTIEVVMGDFVRISEGYRIAPSERMTLTLQEEDLRSREEVRNRYLGKGIWQSSWNKVILRDFLIKNNLHFKEGIYWEDTLWLFFVVKHLSHLYIIPDVTYYYVKRPQGLTTGMVSGQELARFWCIVYDEIANNFTEGEVCREAKYHMRGLCFRCIDAADQHEFRRIAKKYRKVLLKGLCLSSWLLLTMIVFLSRFRWGRNTFLRIAKKANKHK